MLLQDLTPTCTSHIWIHFNWTGSNTRDWDSNYQKERYQNNYPHTVYCTIWEVTGPSYPVNHYQVAIQYWFFYPYDDWANDHEGDWEHINVLITSQFDTEAYIEKVQFYFHEKWKEWEPNNLEFDDNTHVVVYIGGEAIPPQFYRFFNVPYCGWNSNASYPGKNSWQDVGSDFFGKRYDDKVYGEGPKISYNEIINSNKYHPDTQVWTEKDYYQLGYGLILLRDANYWEQTGFFKKYPKYSWLKSAILVGEPSQDPSSESFRSYHCPFNKPDWRQLGGFGAYQYYY